MLRRVISAIVIATAAALAPAGAAHADQADTDYSEYPCVITFDSQSVRVGEPVGFTVECADTPVGTVTVQVSFAGQAAAADDAVDVAGADSAQLLVGGDGTATDTASLSAAGDYMVQALDADGQALSETYTITAVEAGSPMGAGSAGAGSAGAGSAGGGVSLASTGSTSLPYLAIAGGLLLAGVAAIVVSRVRATRRN
ncbi:LPXTG cell wall anchor domain-containing protein [Promicromonospora panici]|uniref:LPXTG cell wall anchor domain-containing protein n=1 Tax=Promicromonospora panici TaxID=2219658 RepID=UPI00101C6870|nr:LPXTG cell wall anchor domain-containing protein [Promicromonospora panici]